MTQALNLANFANNLNTAGATSNSGLQNSSVIVTAGTGMSGGGAVALGSSVTLTNAGVTSIVAGTGISISGATGAVTITNSLTGGVTSAVAGNGIAVSGATGAVTFSLGAVGANTVGTYILTNIFMNYGQSLSYGDSCSVGTGNKQVKNDNIFGACNAFSQGAIGVSGTWRFLGRSVSLPVGTGGESIMSIAVRIA